MTVLILIFNLPCSNGFVESIRKHINDATIPRIIHKPGDYSRSLAHQRASDLKMSENLENAKFIYTQPEAVKIIRQFVPAPLQVGIDNYQISGFQAIKKIKHSKGMGSNLQDFGITQEELNYIDRTGGIVKYIQRGGKLPSVDLVREYQENTAKFCCLPDTLQKPISLYQDEDLPGHLFYNNNTRVCAIFDATTGEFIMAEKFRRNSLKEMLNSANFGKMKVPRPLEEVDVSSKNLNLNTDSIREMAQKLDILSENTSCPNPTTEPNKEINIKKL
jgi:hypothetical protein